MPAKIFVRNHLIIDLVTSGRVMQSLVSVRLSVPTLTFEPPESLTFIFYKCNGS